MTDPIPASPAETAGPDHLAVGDISAAELGAVEDTSKLLTLAQRRVIYLTAGPLGVAAGAVAAGASTNIVPALVGLIAGAVSAACGFLVTGLALANPSR